MNQGMNQGMNQETLKKKLLETYLKQQGSHQKSTQSLQMHNANTSLNTSVNTSVSTVKPTHEIVPVQTTDNISLEEFREYVKKWFELDNTIKRAQEAIRERKKLKDKLSITISAFMCKYDIEDLNTKEGRIRCKVQTVKAPVSQKVVKQRITDFFNNDEKKKSEILSKIYEEREEKEKVSLRRLKITNS
jgi:hypothetical protein